MLASTTSKKRFQCPNRIVLRGKADMFDLTVEVSRESRRNVERSERAGVQRRILVVTK